MADNGFIIDMDKEYDVFGIGNAMMDFLIEVEMDIINKFRLTKGQFTLVDAQELAEIFERIELSKFQRVPGGSSANIITGIAQLGGRAVFCGKVGPGENGRYYEEKLNESGVISRLSKSDEKTSKALTFITPDTQRTFAGFLGASIQMIDQDILEEDIKESKIVHIEGYQLQGDCIKASMHALSLAKKHGIPISIDLNDAAYIRGNTDIIRNILKESVDIVFANEEEAEALTGEADPKKSAELLSELTSLAIVKNGSLGSFISHGKVTINIPAYRAVAIDSTGAGDMYAAGFLYGITHGNSFYDSGLLGSYAAARIVAQIGARYNGDMLLIIKEWDEIIASNCNNKTNES